MLSGGGKEKGNSVNAGWGKLAAPRKGGIGKGNQNGRRFFGSLIGILWVRREKGRGGSKIRGDFRVVNSGNAISI